MVVQQTGGVNVNYGLLPTGSMGFWLGTLLLHYDAFQGFKGVTFCYLLPWVSILLSIDLKRVVNGRQGTDWVKVLMKADSKSHRNQKSFFFLNLNEDQKFGRLKTKTCIK